MTYDQSQIDDAVLAVLAAFSFDARRAWKGFDFDVMGRLGEQGFIDNLVGKTKSCGSRRKVLSAAAIWPSVYFAQAQAQTLSVSFSFEARRFATAQLQGCRLLSLYTSGARHVLSDRFAAARCWYRLTGS